MEKLIVYNSKLTFLHKEWELFFGVKMINTCRIFHVPDTLLKI